MTEVEFHVDAAALPETIIAAAKKLIPGGYVGDCEIEYHGGKLYYEVTCTVKGIEKAGATLGLRANGSV